MRLLLTRQDELVSLERELDSIDREEQRQLFLGSIGKDQNKARKDTLKQVSEALVQYGKMLPFPIGLVTEQGLSPSRWSSEAMFLDPESSGCIQT